MIAIISNYNKDDKARLIRDSIKSCHVSIVDSSGKYKPSFIPTNSPFGVGCYNKSVELFLNSGHEIGFFVCSDVECNNWEELLKKCKLVMQDKTIGTYSPSVSGCAWKHEKQFSYSLSQPVNGLRTVMFCEGMIFCIRKEVAENVGKITKNKHGYGVDSFIGFTSINMGLKNIIDDSVVVNHPFSKSYSDKEAKKEGNIWMRSKGIEFYKFCRKLGLCTTFIERTIARLIGNNKLYYR